MSVRDEIWVIETLQQLDFYEDLFQPAMIIAYWNSLARKFAQRHTVQNVLHQKHYASASTTEFPDLDKEPLKIAWSKAGSFDP